MGTRVQYTYNMNNGRCRVTKPRLLLHCGGPLWHLLIYRSQRLNLTILGRVLRMAKTIGTLNHNSTRRVKGALMFNYATSSFLTLGLKSTLLNGNLPNRLLVNYVVRLTVHLRLILLLRTFRHDTNDLHRTSTKTFIARTRRLRLLLYRLRTPITLLRLRLKLLFFLDFFDLFLYNFLHLFLELHLLKNLRFNDELNYNVNLSNDELQRHLRELRLTCNQQHYRQYLVQFITSGEHYDLYLP